MVALAVLSVIVLLLSAAFQQSSDAWLSASKRGDRDLMARSVLGRVETELMQAVPAKFYPGAASYQYFGSDGISFLLLRAGGQGERELRRVMYSHGGKIVRRTETLLRFDGNNWNLAGNVSSENMNSLPDAPLDDFKFSVPADPSGENWGQELPPSVEVYFSVLPDKEVFLFKGRSYGPRGKNPSEDGYIYVGGSK